MSDPSLSEIDFKNKIAWVWATFNVIQSFLQKTQILFLEKNFEMSQKQVILKTCLVEKFVFDHSRDWSWPWE